MAISIKLQRTGTAPTANKFLVTAGSADTGKLQITYNGEDIYNNLSGATPDILSGVSNTDIYIPLDANDKIYKGVYYINFVASSGTSDADYINFQVDSINPILGLFEDTYAPEIRVDDNTNYDVINGTVTSSSRSITLTYPEGSNQSNLVSSSATITNSLYVTTGNVWTGSTQALLNYNVTWSIATSNGAGVTYSPFTYQEVGSGYEDIFIDSENTLCDLYDNINALRERVANAQNNNRTNYQSLLEDYQYVGALMAQLREAITCNKTAAINDIISQIKFIVGNGITSTVSSPASKRIYGVSSQITMTISDASTEVKDVDSIIFSGATVTNDGNGQVTVTITGGGGGSSTFTGLSDTPSSYTGQGGKLVQVNSGESALEFSSTPVVDSIQLSGGTGTEGTLTWNNTDKTVDLDLDGVTLQVGQEEVLRVVNKTAGNLLEADFRAVRVRLVSEGGAQGQRLAVVLAQADSDVNSATAIGIVTEDIAVNQEGFITISGNVNGIDTTGAKSWGGLETWADGDILYLSPDHAGYLTNVKPLTPGHLVVMGYVVYAHANQGKIFVKVDNGYELEELHDVLITSITDNELLQWNAAGPYWENRTLAEAGIQPAGTYVTSVSATAPMASTGGTTPTINMAEATAISDGYLKSADWNTFNNKLSAIVNDDVPTLGNDLNVSNFSIISTSTNNITLDPQGTGVVRIDGLNWPAADGSTNDVLTTDGTGNLSWTTPTYGTVRSVSGTGSVGGLTLSGTVTSVGSLTLGGALDIQADTSPTLGGNLDSNQLNITNADTITSDKYVATTNALVIGGTTSWDVSNGSFATLALSQDVTTLAITNMTAGMPAVLRIDQKGAYAIGAWTDGTNAVKWSGGTAPTITATAGRFDIVSFISDGTYIYGSIVQDFQ